MPLDDAARAPIHSGKSAQSQDAAPGVVFVIDDTRPVSTLDSIDEFHDQPPVPRATLCAQQMVPGNPFLPGRDFPPDMFNASGDIDALPATARPALLAPINKPGSIFDMPWYFPLSTAPARSGQHTRDFQAREVQDAFDIDLFINRIQPLNPGNPYHGAVEPLDSNSLQRYYALGMAKPSAETRHAAELLTMGEDEFALIEAVGAYVAFEIDRHADGADDSLPWTAPHPCEGNVPVSAAVRCAAPEMDGVMEVQDFDNFQMITYTPVPAAHPLPPRYLQWLDGCGEPAEVETEFENQVVLCASNAEDAHSPGW